jgi:hypothetical protein
MCCGQKRSQLAISQPVIRTRPIPVSPPAPIPRNQVFPRAATLAVTTVPASVSGARCSIAVRYVESAPVRVLGLATGRRYEFSGSQAVQEVDARDAASLLSTRFFRRA